MNKVPAPILRGISILLDKGRLFHKDIVPTMMVRLCNSKRGGMVAPNKGLTYTVGLQTIGAVFRAA